MSVLTVENVSVSYENKTNVLNQLSMIINRNEFICVVGKSGCGKTTLLKTIIGLIPLEEGNILLEGVNITNRKPFERQLGVVFQEYGLFPHLSVQKNIEYGIREENKQSNVDEILSVCDIFDIKNRLPNTLSGGQKQRVALARALISSPKLLLLDEPFSQLDIPLRKKMRKEIKRIHEELQSTTLFVSHDMEECFALADRIAFLNNGRIEQFDKNEDIYYHPKTKFVAEMVGFDNIHKQNNGMYRCIRSNDIIINSSKKEVKAKINEKSFINGSYYYQVITNDNVEYIVNCKSSNFEINQDIYLSFLEDKIILVKE